MPPTPLLLPATLMTHLTLLTIGLYDVYKVDPEYGGGWSVISTYDETGNPAILFSHPNLDECLAWVDQQMNAAV